MATPIAVVTGSNKGIGYAIVKGLCQKLPEGTVYLTARNPDLGHKAIAQLKGELTVEEYAKIHFHQLDITDEASAIKFCDHLLKEHGGIDILINNAGFAFKEAAPEPFGEQAVITTGINYYGTKKFSDIVFPLLRSHARFAKEGTHEAHGYPNGTYRVSKAAEIALTMIQHSQMLKDSRKDIVVNACCPGYVSTDMTSHKGNLTIEQGADTPIYLALLPADTTDPKGQFIFQRKVIPWAP